MSDYEQSYLGQLRQQVGKRKLLINTVRAVIQDQAGDVLLIQRRDNLHWSLPAGSMELDESVLDACKREILEETGLTITEATLIAIHSHPRYSFINAEGNAYQNISFVFRVDSWLGDVVTETEETVAARFFSFDTLPVLSSKHLETLEDLKQFNGTVILK